MSNSSSASTLATVLANKGLPATMLASETGLSLNTVRRVVSGEQEPSLIHALLIAAVVEQEVEALFSPHRDPREGRKRVNGSCGARSAR